MIARGQLRTWWIGCLALAIVSGCGGPSDYDDFRDQLASRYCDYLVRCGVLGASETGQCPAAFTAAICFRYSSADSPLNPVIIKSIGICNSSFFAP